MEMDRKLLFMKEKYQKAFQEYGHSSRSLLVGTDRQYMRFYELLKRFEINSNSSILDVGCGFGDLQKFCVNYYKVSPKYTGIDYCSEFVEAVNCEQRENCTFIVGDFLTVSDLPSHNFCVASGIFNVFNDECSGDVDDEFLRSIVSKMFSLCTVGISFNFVTDKVDFKKKGITYHSPARVLDFCYSMSRNIVLDNTCMPFEATITVFKDDSFNETRVLNSFIRAHAPSVENGLLSGEFE